MDCILKGRVAEVMVNTVRLVQRYTLDGEPILRNIDLSVEAGQLVLVVGPSGCGKSTLAACLKGIIPHQLESVLEGSIEVAGLDTLQSSPAEIATRVGMVFQDPETQLCNLYIEDEVAFGCENLRFEPDRVMQLVRESLSFVGLPLSEVADKFVYELSGGQKQRLAIASVLAMSPRLLIFDEPTANLDPQGGWGVIDAIKRLHRLGHTVVVIEHKIEDLIEVADRLIVMQEGQVRLDGPPRRLLAEHGEELRDQFGLWVPQVVDLALNLRHTVTWDPFPLTVTELVDQLLPGVHNPGLQALPAPERADQLISDPPDPIIAVRDVAYSYPDGTPALQGVSFNIGRGETVAIAGTNGSGKTTMAKALISLLRPQAGSARVCGLDVFRTPVQQVAKHAGYVFQYPEHQFVKDGVFAEVAYGLEVHGFEPETVQAKTQEVLDWFGLTGMEQRHPLNLSGGQKRRLSVATMLVLDPEVLILDEPTFGQDQDNSRKMMEYLLSNVRRRSNHQLTTILITHDMELIAEYCDRVLVMSRGKLLFNGRPRELFQNSEVLRQGSLRNIQVNQVVQALHRSGVDIWPDILRPAEFMEWYRQRRLREVGHTRIR